MRVNLLPRLKINTIKKIITMLLKLTFILFTVSCSRVDKVITLSATTVADIKSVDKKDFSKLCSSVAAVFGADIKLIKVEFKPAGLLTSPASAMGQQAASVPLPDHCEIIGAVQERIGVDQQRYSIKFHLRLPSDWNGRLYMEGGGGTNGNVGNALGPLSDGSNAVSKGYAVLSQDSGHDNTINSLPQTGGTTAFGLDPIARANYGGKSLPIVVDASKKIITHYYDSAPKHSYFVGCSKGGQEGMMLAQRYPELFDGIIAAAPGMSLPRAAIAEAWDTQSFALAASKPLTMTSLAQSFSDRDLQLVRDAVLAACDSLDGINDGMVSSFPACKSNLVLSNLRAKTCVTKKNDACITEKQISAIERVQQGAKDSSGKLVYASFPFDVGWGDSGWRMWKIGSSDGKIPSINVMMGAPALANIFTVPPKRVPFDLRQSLDFAMSFDVKRDSQDIYATSGEFSTSSWRDIGARSSDLTEFKNRGGKLIVPHGVSDPVFSINDTILWWQEVDADLGGMASEVVRVFPIPGMNHCSGGPATSNIDTFTALVDWVENKKAPDQIIGTAGSETPWPGRTRPICAYPATAHYEHGNSEVAESFSCKASTY